MTEAELIKLFDKKFLSLENEYRKICNESTLHIATIEDLDFGYWVTLQRDYEYRLYNDKPVSTYEYGGSYNWIIHKKDKSLYQVFYDYQAINKLSLEGISEKEHLIQQYLQYKKQIIFIPKVKWYWIPFILPFSLLLRLISQILPYLHKNIICFWYKGKILSDKEITIFNFWKML